MNSAAPSLTVVVELDADPSRIDEFQTLVQEELLPGTRAYAGCEHIDEYADAERPTCTVLVQRWADRSAFDGYLEWRRGSGDLSQLSELLVRPPSFRYLVSTCE